MNIAAENVQAADVEAVDVVVSYATADSERVEVLVKALRDAGLTVWRADPARNGNRWRDDMEDRIEAARVVVAVWSKASVRASSIVYEDAKLALDDGILLAVRFDPSEPPLGFRDVRAFDLAQWPGELTLLVAATGRQVAGAGVRSELPVEDAEVEPAHADLKALANAVMKAAIEGNASQRANATQALTAALAMDDKGLEGNGGEGLLQALREQRAHEAVVEIAEALISRGDASVKVRCLHAQSLIDVGRVNAAIDHLKATLDLVGTGEREYIEALGLLGRAHKQLYVNDGRKPKSAQAEKALRQALVYYAEAVVVRTKQVAGERGEAADDTVHVEKDVWNGINLIALQALAARDGIVVPRYCDPKMDAPKMIARIQAGEIGPWEEATLGEAYVALGEFETAAVHYGTFLANVDTTMFQKFSALRQLREVWQLQPGADSAGQLLAGFETKFASAIGGGLQINTDAIESRLNALNAGAVPIYDAVLRASAIDFGQARAQPETVIGHHAANLLDWYKMMLARAKSVGRVKHPKYGTIGTGFVVHAGDLDMRLGDELIFLTNAHVVTGGKAERGLQRALGVAKLPNPPARAQEIAISFDEGPRKVAGRDLACDLIWESPVAELDVAILRFKKPPGGLQGLPIASELPPLRVRSASQSLQAGDYPVSRKSRVFVIGHPNNRGLSVATESCHLLQKGPKTLWGEGYKNLHFLHYQTPTEGGNSGSPVFEECNWSVIGVHHFGLLGDKIPSLDGKRMWKANEGVSIFSIRDAVRQAVTAGEIKPRI